MAMSTPREFDSRVQRGVSSVRCQNSFRGRTRLLAVMTGSTVQGGKAQQLKLRGIITQCEGSAGTFFGQPGENIESETRTLLSYTKQGPLVFVTNSVICPFLVCSRTVSARPEPRSGVRPLG